MHILFFAVDNSTLKTAHCIEFNSSLIIVFENPVAEKINHTC
jgi:hypothetical protein